MRLKIGIIGNGFVGSAIVNAFALKSNIKIYDIDKNKCTHSLQDVVNDSDFVFLCLPTPMESPQGGPINLSIYRDTLKSISICLKNKGQIFIIKSTVVPGTTKSFCEDYPDLNFCFNPEFLTERTSNLDFINSNRIILGGSDIINSKVEAMYRIRFPWKKIIKTNYQTAELIKYMCNCFFSTKVSFMNEMKQVANIIGANWDDAVHGFISDGRIGNSHIDVPGHDNHLGFGGKCFPKDLNSMIHYSETIGVDPKVMKAVWQKNLEVRAFLDWTEIIGAVTNKEDKK